ncbi:MAG: hypothetical protein TREMPRED_002416 [Tremellales sp. Tagirdzhanova-0007]|nr:MAG: hypothetical protein TREMPRED_002416 [Tremellales sp. Tagirdzhanova-0007]
MNPSGAPSKTTNHPKIRAVHDTATSETNRSSIDAGETTSAQSSSTTELQQEAQKRITAHIGKFLPSWRAIRLEACDRGLGLIKEGKCTSSFPAKTGFEELYKASRGLCDDSYILIEHLSPEKTKASEEHATSLRNTAYNYVCTKDEHKYTWSVYDKGFSSLLDECRKSENGRTEEMWDRMKARLTKESMSGEVLYLTLTDPLSTWIEDEEKLSLIRYLGLNLSWTIGELNIGVPEA